MQVTLEFNGAVPRLEGECGGPQVPEFSLEEPGRKPVSDATCAQRIFIGPAEIQQLQTVLHGEPHRSHWDLRSTAIDKPCRANGSHSRNARQEKTPIIP